MTRSPLWDNIPDELKLLPNWVYWKYEERDGKTTKIPYNARTGRWASSTDPNTWSSFEQACKTAVNGNGIGFVFPLEGGYVGLDIDKQQEPELVDWFGTYAERSVSGKGCHIIMRGFIDKAYKLDPYELYTSKRYFTFTGDLLNGKPIRNCQEKLEEFIRNVFSAPVASAKEIVETVNLLDLCGPPISSIIESDILERIQRSNIADDFNSLWNGDISKYGNDDSRADAALLAYLRFWTGGNQEQSFSLFMQSELGKRNKAKRPDYLPRTWELVKNGKTYEPVMSIPEGFVIKRNQSTPPWRRISISDVESAIAGTLIDPLCKALASPSDPPLPFEIVLAKALPLCGCALSGRVDTPEAILRGNKLSRIKILTGNGQTPNFWTLAVGESASGKDIGGITEDVAMQFKWLIGSAGSEEGIADAYIKNPVGLLTISEMMNWLDCHHWQSKASGFLTYTFNRGYFIHNMSQHKDRKPRQSNYCYPNISAYIQPGILQRFADETHLDSGFLGRFIIIKMPEFVVYPAVGSLDDKVETVKNIISILNSKAGSITPPQFYNKPLNDMFISNKATPAPSWKRLTAEYYPRLAMLLSFPIGDDSTEVYITPDGWRRADIVIQYLFAQAESVLNNLHFDPVQAKFEALCTKILSAIKASPDQSCLLSEIGYKLQNGTKAKDRSDAIRELEDRRLIFREEKTTAGRKAFVLKLTPSNLS